MRQYRCIRKHDHFLPMLCTYVRLNTQNLVRRMPRFWVNFFNYNNRMNNFKTKKLASSQKLAIFGCGG